MHITKHVCVVCASQSKETHVVAPAVQIEMWKDPGIQIFFMGTGGQWTFTAGQLKLRNSATMTQHRALVGEHKKLKYIQ